LKKIVIYSSLLSSLLLGAKLESVRVYSSSIVTDELRSASFSEIYSSEDMKSSQNLYEFLNTHTSLVVMPSYGNSYTQQLDMRGFGLENGHQNIVINIDGRRLNNIDGVPQLLSSIPISSIERVEIVKSSGIVENGDGANSGVINIFTKNDSSKEVGFYGGTYGLYGGSFAIGERFDALRLNLSGDGSKNRGIRKVYADGSKDKSKFGSLNLNLAYDINSDLELRARAFSSYVDTVYGGYMSLSEFRDDPKQQGSSIWGTPSVANNQTYKTKGGGAGLSYNIDENLLFSLDADREKKSSDYETTGYSATSNYTYDTLRSSLLYEDSGFSVVGGLDMFDGKREDDKTSYSIENKTKKQNLSVYAKARYSFDNHSFEAGGRADRVKYSYSDATQSLSKKDSLSGFEAGYNYVYDSVSSMFFNYAHAYESPDIDRFFDKDFLGVVSFNGFINPAKSDSFTLGYNNITNTNKLKLSAYYIKLKDEIYYYSDPAFIASKNTNIDKSHKWGFDIYDKFSFGKFNAMLNYNFVVAKIDDEVENGEKFSSKTLPGVSKHNIKATLEYEVLADTHLSFTQIYRSKAYAFNDFSNSFAQKQKRYTSSNVALRYLKDNYEVFAKVDNIFGKKNGLWTQDDAIYPTNYTTTALAGVKVRF